jgi:tellurite resistance protein TerC
MSAADVLSRMGGNAALWAAFSSVLVLLALDLGILHKKPREPSIREALAWTALWAGLAAVFGTGIALVRGAKPAGEFFTAYLVEQALSIDNLFVMLVVFGELSIPRHLRRRVLGYGIGGAIVLRGVLLFCGTSVIERFHVLGLMLGGVLVVGSVRMARELSKPPKASEDDDPKAKAASTSAVKMLSRFLPLTDRFHGERFTVLRNGIRYATPLFVAVITIEVADIVFALDSIPAVLGVSSDKLVVFTSNVFAILGLRSLYFALEGLLERLRYLKHGLAGVLFVVGAKMLLAPLWVVPTWLSLGAVLGILATAFVASTRANRSLSKG